MIISPLDQCKPTTCTSMIIFYYSRDVFDNNVDIISSGWPRFNINVTRVLLLILQI